MFAGCVGVVLDTPNLQLNSPLKYRSFNDAIRGRFFNLAPQQGHRVVFPSSLESSSWARTWAKGGSYKKAVILSENP